MENVLKTKDVSNLLGVSPNTVIRWVKNHNIDCQLNEQGHYVFDSAHVEQLKSIQLELKAGRKKEQATEERAEMVPRHVFNRKVKEMMEKIEALEYQLHQKADDVVTYQLLNHRKEIEEMNKILLKMEQRVANVEEKLTDANQVESRDKTKRRSLMHIFSTN